MIPVITMSRVSSDDQADRGYSIQDQDDKLQKYCERMGFTVIAHYREDHSAKTFERPEFQKMLVELRTRRLRPAKILFVRWCRFSRNTGLGYVMLDTMKAMGIEVNAIEQPIDHNIPEQKPLLALYMSLPEAENIRRGLNTQTGMRRALKEGRYIGPAPRGYQYEVQPDKRPMIVPNEKAQQVQYALERVATGLYSVEQVYFDMRRSGYKGSKSQFYNMLRNPLYVGIVRVPPLGQEPEQLVPGVHAPLVSRATWDAAQDVMDGRKRRHVKTTTNYVNMPLRGHLVCPRCGGNLTGSGSKNRVGDVYYYYHCHKPCPTRFRADAANAALEEMMAGFELPAAWAQLFYAVIKDMLAADDQRRLRDLQRTQAEILKNEERLREAENLLFDKTIDAATYTNARQRYAADLDRLRADADQLTATGTHTEQKLRYCISLISNLHKHYAQAVLEVKQQLLCSIFPQKLVFDGTHYRTQKINPLLEVFKVKYNELRGGGAPPVSGVFREGDPRRTIVEHLNPQYFLDSLESLFALKDLIPVEELSLP